MGKLRQRIISSNITYKQCLSASELLKVEADSLTKMMTLRWPKPMALWKQKVSEAAAQAKNQGLLNTHVWFNARDPRANATHFIELGVQITPKNHPLVTYFFAIGQPGQSSKREGLRKLHFDLEYSSNGREPKPRSHLQVAGRFPAPLGEVGYESTAFDHLRPDLDKPRVPCLPQSFALLVHFALLEYHTTEASLEKFVHSPEWLRVVTTAEGEVLKPYFEHGQKWLTSAAADKHSFLSDSYGFSSS